MHQILTLAKKEFRSYFDSPVAYVVITLFLLISGWQFSTTLFLSNSADLRTLFGIIRFILLFFIPALSMRLISEEKRLGTIELLMTLPIKDWQLVLGKFLAAYLLVIITILLTLIHYVTIAMMGEPDFGATVGGYLGLILVVGVYLAIGIFTSSLTQNQIVAFIASFAIIFVLFIFDKVVIFFPGFIGNIIEYLSIDYHFNNVSRGVIDSRNLIYYASMIFVFLFLTVQSLESRKWK
ncbi:MAG: ABC transporter [candidate division Zixibacteria bacterium HGW-Zixibacteria-1]|nr:MAG: ABC transporter [candidate division Zixibacteria bacterium HGW-Zixibacteria-1]